jgi:hypothetical protein
MKLKGIELMLLAIALAMMFTVTGCGNLPPKPDHPLTVHQRYEVACVGGYAALPFIAKVNALHPFPAATQATILRDKDKLEKKFHCILAPGEDYPYTLDEILLRELESASATLIKIKAEAQ